MDILTLEILAASLLGATLGILFYRSRIVSWKKKEKQLPTHWSLRLRPIFSDVDHAVWLWLKQVFPEHEVLVKVPVLRFLSGSSGDLKAMIQIKDIYCSFTVCSPKGRVLGCIDVPGAKGLKASRRDLKKKLFESCGLPYAVFGAQDLPTHEALRTFFLNEDMPSPAITSQFEAVHSSQTSEFDEAEAMPVIESVITAKSDDAASVRNSLHVKLDGNRKRRLAAMESLKMSAGVVEDNAEQGLAPRWDDSFIMGEGNDAYPSRPNA